MKRPRRLRRRQPPTLYVETILAWADAHHARTGRWPTSMSGEVLEASAETWGAIDSALRNGRRGLSGTSSLPQLLAERRDVPYRMREFSHTVLSVERILGWADEHHARTGAWPSKAAGLIHGTDGERWSAIDAALYQGMRGLAGGTTLAWLLAAQRGRFHPHRMRPLTAAQILAWADAHRVRTGQWPRKSSGAIPESPGDTWSHVQDALHKGLRGLHGGMTLPQLLARERGTRNKAALPQLTEEQILAWADAHSQHSGRWPSRDSGNIAGSAGEVWANVDAALKMGLRGLASGSSLAKLLYVRRGCSIRGGRRPSPASLPAPVGE